MTRGTRLVLVLAVMLTLAALGLTAASIWIPPLADYYKETGVTESSPGMRVLLQATYFWTAKWWLFVFPLAGLWVAAALMWKLMPGASPPPDPAQVPGGQD